MVQDYSSLPFGFPQAAGHNFVDLLDNRMQGTRDWANPQSGSEGSQWAKGRSVFLLLSQIASCVRPSQASSTRNLTFGSSLPALRWRTTEQIRSSGIDVLLLDSLSLLYESDSLRLFRERPRPVHLILIGGQNDQQLFLNAVRAGVAAYVSGDGSAKDLVGAVRSVAQGEGVCPPRLCRFLFDYVAGRARPAPSGPVNRHRRLTRRERELILLVGQGLTNKEIAGRLGLSEQTVKNHVHRILRKLGASDRANLMETYRIRESEA